MRPPRNHVGKHDAAVDIGADQIAVGGADRHAAEHRDAALRVAALRPVKLLVDYRVEAVVATMLDRHARTGRIGEQSAAGGKAHVLEFPQLSPAAEFQRAGQSLVLLAEVTLELCLADNE